MNRHILASQREMVELESQARLRFEDVAHRTKPANDFCIGSRHNERKHFVAGNEILDQSRPFRKAGLNGIDLGNGDLPQRRIRRIHSRDLSQPARELSLLESDAVVSRVCRQGTVFGLKTRIVDVQFFAQAIDVGQQRGLGLPMDQRRAM